MNEAEIIKVKTQQCPKCGEINAPLKKTCIGCGIFLEGYTVNNVTGRYGYRHADGTFTPNEENRRINP